MEFPELGSHCTVSSCKQLDFLPFECDACHKIFCKHHQTYEQHNCTEGFGKSVLVPTCPLCNQPVPVARGEDPNIKVNNHIQQECRSEKAKKLYTNRCSFPGCKKKELVPVTCNICRQNFCLKHRFETNHNCQGPRRATNNPKRPFGAVKSKPSVPARSRNPHTTTLSTIGADLNRERLQRQQQRQQATSTSIPQSSSHVSEDEALRRAIAASLNDQPTTSQPQPSAVPQQSQNHTQQANCDEDEALARAIAASLNEQPPKPKSKPRTQRQSSSSDCRIS